MKESTRITDYPVEVLAHFALFGNLCEILHEDREVNLSPNIAIDELGIELMTNADPKISAEISGLFYTLLISSKPAEIKVLALKALVQHVGNDNAVLQATAKYLENDGGLKKIVEGIEELLP